MESVSALLYFLLWGGALFLLMRFGCGAHVMGHGYDHDKAAHKDDDQPEQAGTRALQWIPPAEDVDPICKKSVKTDTAKLSVHEGGVYYICSSEYRERFEAAPEQYLNSLTMGPQPQLENHHV